MKQEIKLIVGLLMVALLVDFAGIFRNVEIEEDTHDIGFPLHSA